MDDQSLPLLTLFHQLREHGLPLGTDDYLAVVRAWQLGLGLDDRAALLNLCLTVWARSGTDSGLIELLFDASFPVDASRVEPAGGTPAAAAPWTPPNVTFAIMAAPGLGEPGRIVQNVRRQVAGSGHVRPSDDYLPATRRQMIQSWRYWHRAERADLAVVVDSEATIAHFAATGTLPAPGRSPRRGERLLLLVDQNGSMAPFHTLTRQLVATAVRTGPSRRTRVYYFHDCPETSLFSDPALHDAQPLDVVLASAGRPRHIMIVSDAGAARGGPDAQRVEQTASFLAGLRRNDRIVWLNPLPHARWADAPAAAIAQQVPMFPLSRAGFDAAINVLRGRRGRPAQSLREGSSE